VAMLFRAIDPQQSLKRSPLPHGHGLLRPTTGDLFLCTGTSIF